MKQTAVYHTLIEKTLHEKRYGASPKELYEPVDYIMSLGGKRMRPLLVLMACEMFDGDITQALNSAIGIELFHNFTLIHDDIMDNAPLRRNKPTVHEKWNTNIAILSGDVMMVEAYKEFCKLDSTVLPAVLSVFNDTAKKVCEGQQMDMNYETMSQVSIDQYVQMITLKTAVLLGGSLKIGALIGNASEEHAQLLYDFGKNMGIAFQLQDDILDVYGNMDKVGKQQGGDIIANKKTYLLLKAMELAENDVASSQSLAKWINTTGNDSAKVEAVTAIFNSLEVKALAEREMNRYYDKAMCLLQAIPVDEAKKLGLIDLSSSIMQRES